MHACWVTTYIQGKLEERNAGYWRIVTTLDQEIPPAWVTHAARKRAKLAKAQAAAAAAAAEEDEPEEEEEHEGEEGEGFARNGRSPVSPWSGDARLLPRGPFEDRVDRVFFFGDLNYRVDLSREDLELGVSVGRREEEGVEGRPRGTRIGGRFRPGDTREALLQQ